MSNVKVHSKKLFKCLEKSRVLTGYDINRKRAKGVLENYTRNTSMYNAQYYRAKKYTRSEIDRARVLEVGTKEIVAICVDTSLRESVEF